MRRASILLFTLALSITQSGCELVGDILELGFWVLLIMALLVAGLAWGGFRAIQKMGRRRDEPGS